MLVKLLRKLICLLDGCNPVVIKEIEITINKKGKGTFGSTKDSYSEVHFVCRSCLKQYKNEYHRTNQWIPDPKPELKLV